MQSGPADRYSLRMSANPEKIVRTIALQVVRGHMIGLKTTAIGTAAHRTGQTLQTGTAGNRAETVQKGTTGDDHQPMSIVGQNPQTDNTDGTSHHRDMDPEIGSTGTPAGTDTDKTGGTHQEDRDSKVNDLLLHVQSTETFSKESQVTTVTDRRDMTEVQGHQSH